MKIIKPIPVENDLIVLENREDLVKNSAFHIMFDHKTALCSPKPKEGNV
jgi:hypothetical protein